LDTLCLYFISTGTKEERGISAWEKDVEKENLSNCLEGNEVYDIPLPACIKRSKFLKYIPTLPNYDEFKEKSYSMNGPNNLKEC